MLNFDPTQVFRSEECLEFFRTWNDLRGDNLMPTQDEFDIDQYPDLKPGIAILEVHSDDVSIFREVGGNYYAFFGRDVTGMNLIALSPEQDRKTRGERQMNMSRYPCGSYTILSLEAKPGFLVKVETVGLPVKSVKPGKPAQIYSQAKILETEVQAGERRDIVIPAANDFQYLDIGAGLPPVEQELRAAATA